MRAVSSAIVLLSALAALASPHSDRRDHAGLAKRMQLEKRTTYTNARFTWYPTDTGADACTGKNHKDSDWYVALNMPLFGGSGNGHCGKQIKITAKGKSTVATVVDACATCYSASDIDMTKGLFEFFDGNLGDGVFYGSWEFLDGSGGDDGDNGDDGDSHSTPKPSPKPTTHTTPTTHYTPKTTPKTTTHYTPKTTPKTTADSSSSTSVTSSKSSSTTLSVSSTSSSLTVISTTPVISTPSTTPTVYPTDVANAGSDPSTSSAADIQGGISNNVGPDSGSIRLAFNKATLGLTALALVAVQAL